MTYTKQTRNQYEVTLTSGSKIKVLSADVLGVAESYDTSSDPITVIRKTDTGIVFLQEEGIITFSTASDGSGDTYPSSFEVDVNDSVILTAIPAAGYEFIRWLRNGTEVSTSAVTKIKVTALATGETSAVYTAKFSPIASS